MATEEATELVRRIHPSEQSKRQWRVALDGVSHASPALVELASRYGVLRYGWTVGDYDGWVYREVGGGGVITVPFAIKDGAVLVGVVEQVRPNQGGTVLNVPRGFIEAGEAHANAARRELAEETGLSGGKPSELGGQPVNPNSAFFDTRGAGEGARFYALELDADCLVPDGDGYLLREDRLDRSANAAEDRAREQIGKLRFIAWSDAASLSDMFTVAAVGRLLAQLQRSGRWR